MERQTSNLLLRTRAFRSSVDRLSQLGDRLGNEQEFGEDFFDHLCSRYRNLRDDLIRDTNSLEDMRFFGSVEPADIEQLVLEIRYACDVLETVEENRRIQNEEWEREEQERLKAEQKDQGEQERFSSDEVTRITTELEALRTQLRAIAVQFFPNPIEASRRISQVNNEINILIADIPRKSKIDWRTQAVTAFLALMIAFMTSTDAANRIFYAFEVVNSIYYGQSVAPDAVPPVSEQPQLGQGRQNFE